MPASQPQLLQSLESEPIGGERPVTLSFRTSGEGPVLVEITGHEVEFESRVAAPRGAPLNAARLRYLRDGPVYQLLDGSPGQPFEVRVSAVNYSGAASVSIRVYQLAGDSAADRAAIGAYRHYSNAIQLTESEDARLWRGRVDELRQAAHLFRKSGLKKQALWSEWLLANFTYFPVSEYRAASELATSLRREAHRAGMPQLELAALQLQGQALMERDDEDDAGRAAEKLEEAQELFAWAEGMARAQGSRFNLAWAINNQGIAFYYRGALQEALERYREVLPLAKQMRDAYLVNLANSNIATVNEKLGNHEQALAALLEIKRTWATPQRPAERVLNLADIGRLYSKLFLFPQAIDELTEAMEIARRLDSSESSGRIGLSLAMAYHDMGQRQRAEDMLTTSIEDMKAVNYGRGLRDAYRLLADIYRSRGDHSAARRYRDEQQRYLRSDHEKAAFLFSRGLDALAAGDRQDASLMFEQSRSAAAAINDLDLQIRSLLQHCTLAPARLDGACSEERLGDMLHHWLSQAPPRYSLDARFSWARLLAEKGREDRALAVLEDLIVEIRLFRSRLGGVLGAWYWESREKIFSFYLDLLLARDPAEGLARETLVSLDRLRNVESNGRPAPGGKDGPDGTGQPDELRSLLAKLGAVADPGRKQELRREIDRLLLNGHSGRPDIAPSGRPPRPWLSLPADAVYLTYYFSDKGAWAWTAGREGVRLVRLDNHAVVVDELDAARRGLRVIGGDGIERHLEKLGELLIGQLGMELPARIYLGPTGDLAGFPFEAIRHGQGYLAQRHVVVNVLTLQGLAQFSSGQGQSRRWNSVVLAGAPDSPGDGFADLQGALREIEDIERLFSPEKVRTLTGAGLSRARFFDADFTNADLIHIASHGSIDLDYPELSRLVLSSAQDSGQAEYLTPLDVQPHDIRAGLVVLSACETSGVNGFSFDSNLGFVTEFLQSGAGAVVASLWPVPDRVTSSFMLEFYQRLIAGSRPADALAQTKRAYIQRPDGAGRPDRGIQQWAAFQIYAN